MKEYSLVLEGGGAKGAYQIGAIRALIENGYSFNTIVGTSIGAINAAFIVQGDIDKIEKLWKTLSFKDLMDINNNIIEKYLSNNLTFADFKQIRATLNKTLKEKGIDTALMRNILSEYIDEEKIRNSKIRFGLVTFCITDLKPQRLFIEDIPKGKLIDYLLASSNLPVFKRAKIDEKAFLDGGTFDNCSVEMLYDAGYRDIIALRLHKKNRIRNYNTLSRNKSINLKMFMPSIELPKVLNFETNTLNKMLEYGYFDTIKQIKKLDGMYYIFNKVSDETIKSYGRNLTPTICLNIAKGANVKFKPGDNIVDVVFNKALPKISKAITGSKSVSLKKQLLSIIEYVASKEDVNPNKIYDLNEFIVELKQLTQNYKLKNGMDNVIYYIVENI